MEVIQKWGGVEGLASDVKLNDCIQSSQSTIMLQATYVIMSISHDEMFL